MSRRTKYKNYLYLAVTADKYELPICVEQTPTLLADMVGISVDIIKTDISRGNNGKRRGIKFVRVAV